MKKIEYAESFITRAQQLLQEMVNSNKLELPYGEPFTNFSVVIGETNKTIVAVLDVPKELIAKIGDKAYIVTEHSK